MAQFMQKSSTTYERSQRSVFVGNISYDVTEEQIKQVFAKAGQIVHFRLVHDRDTGRPKGFGFCEFTDPSTAATAIRIFNGHELNGRPLRVDSAASSDRNMEEAQQLAAVQASRDQPLPVPKPAEENPYGKEPESGKAPEAIAKTISAMPPEQMFELMKQMKQNVITDPAQTRRLLMENPQLAYALLQAQVVMRVVDPKVAYSMLHREVPAVQQPFHQQHADVQQAFHRPPPPVQQQSFQQQSPLQQQPPAGFTANESNQQFRPQGPIHGMHPPRGFSNAPSHFGGPPPRYSAMSGPSNIPTNAPNTADEEKNQAEMLLKVIKLTDEQINLLPPEDQAKVLELRNQLRHKITEQNM